MLARRQRERHLPMAGCVLFHVGTTREISIRISRERIEFLLERARSVRVVVIGDVMLDVYLVGDVERVSPEAPVPVVRVRTRRLAAGGAANVAQNIAAIGTACSLIATVGRDAAGDHLRDMMQAINVHIAGLNITDRPTTTKTRVVARGQQVVRFDEETDTELTGPDVQDLIEDVVAQLESADALVLEDYNKGVLVQAVIHAGIAAARRRGIPIIVDPKFRNFFEFGGATIFKPNRRELEAALGAAVDVDHSGTVPALCAKLGVDNLLLTLGERGMVLFSRQGELCRIPTTAREVYDVVGAGDTVSAYLGAMLASGATVEEAAYIANLAAGVQVSKSGAASVSADELRSHVSATFGS